MITLRRAGERHYERRRNREAWHTFRKDERERPEGGDFGSLVDLDECRLRPGASVTHKSAHGTEVITYVREGALAYEDSQGGFASVQAGEFQHRLVAGRVRHGETNVSRVHPAQVFQIWVQPSGSSVETRHHQRRFSAAERRGVLCLVASPDGRRGSLRVQEDVSVHSAMLEPGQHVVHQLAEGRSAWLHLVEGEASLSDVVLHTGDGAGIVGDRAVSVTARELTELLLLNLGEACGLP